MGQGKVVGWVQEGLDMKLKRKKPLKIYINKIPAVDENQACNLAYTERKQDDWKDLGESKRMMRDREG